MSERLNHKASLRVSKIYVNAWQAATGERAKNYADPQSMADELLQVKDEIQQKLVEGKIDFAEFELCNKLYMGIYEFSKFPSEPSPEVIEQN